MAAIIRSVLVCIVAISIRHVTSQPAKHGVDTTVCNPTQIQASTKIKPTLPNAYSVKIECNFKDKNMTTDFSEYYDQLGNRAAVSQWDTGYHLDGYFSFNTDQLFMVLPDFNKCYTQSISGSSNTILFGYQPNTGSVNSGRIFSANGALRFGNGTKEQYMGTAVVRGINVDHWHSCQYWSDLDATMTVDWYFSVPSWDTAVGKQSIPIRCVVSGNIWENGQPRAFSHTYDLAEFRSQVPPDDKFETPSGIVCPHKKLSKALPIPGPHFTFTAETLTLSSKKIGFIKEYYDFNTSLFRYDYKPESPTQYGTDLLTEVHDYNEGLAYIMDPMIGNCSVNYIDGSGLDARLADSNGNARLRTPKEFFDFDKYQYEYEGVKTVRGIQCDVWITQRNDWPIDNPQNSTWEWWFALPNSWTQSVGHSYVFGMPIQLKMSSPIFSVVYNIYDYNEEEPAIWTFDISKCYNSTEKQDIHFKLPGKYQDTAAKNLELFKYFVLLEVQKWTDISPLRISNMQVDYDDSNVLVSFTMLGPAFMKGNVVQPKQQVDLQTAVTLLNDAINKGVFKVVVDVDTFSDTISLTAKPSSLKQTQHTVDVGYYKAPSGTTYTGGALAALGVVMTVAFFVIGFVAVYIFFRRKTTPNAPGFEPKQFHNEAASDS